MKKHHVADLTLLSAVRLPHTVIPINLLVSIAQLKLNTPRYKLASVFVKLFSAVLNFRLSLMQTATVLFYCALHIKHVILKVDKQIKIQAVTCDFILHKADFYEKKMPFLPAIIQPNETLHKRRSINLVLAFTCDYVVRYRKAKLNNNYTPYNTF